ncbi:MAG: zinc ABC transporter substrate-binding protein [Fibrobacter sp.]|nr:zinc ABC transporter substrate-binding protein [Fibrobacter sp.]
MFKGFVVKAFLAVTLLLAACGTKSETEGAAKDISVIAVTYPQYDWFKNVLGGRADAVDLKLLIKNGADLHSYQPSAQDIAAIAGADMVVYVGGESDEWIEKALAATPKEGRIEVNMMKVLGNRVKEEEVVEGMQGETRDERRETKENAEENHEHAERHHHHDEEEEVENDEHIWLSLKNAEILVKALAESIAKLDTAHAAEYHMNAALYIAKISALDAQYRATMENATLKTILFGDRFPFRYLVDDYGIKYYAAFVGCSAESEASFETITFLAGKMDSLALPAIFTIDGSDGKIARAILNASKNSKNAEVLMLNSMQSVKDEQIKAGADYLSIMRDNLEVLKKAIK